MTAAAEQQLDAPGTCHLVGCPGKGQHPPHGVVGGIGAPTQESYERQVREAEQRHQEQRNAWTLASLRTWLLMKERTCRTITPEQVLELIGRDGPGDAPAFRRGAGVCPACKDGRDA